jgi:hypothetical protein
MRTHLRLVLQTSALVVAIAGAAHAQFRPAEPDFDADGRPRAHIEQDNSSRMSQNFRSGWGPLEPRLDLARTALSVAWDPPTEPRPGRLRFSGRLVVESEGAHVLPLGWHQGITVLVSCDPIHGDRTGADPIQWAQGIGYTETDGRFAVEILGADLRRVVGGSATHAVGLALAEHRTKSPDEGVVSWRRDAVPLDASRHECVVPGPQPLPDALASINATNLEVARHHDPSKTIRSVNLLRSLGKARALRVLRDYCAVAVDGERRCLDASSVDQSHHVRALGVAILLFGSERCPAPCVYGDGDEQRRAWPLFPMALLQDIPIVLPERIAVIDPGDVLAFLDRCEEIGTLRASDLRPTDDPVAAFDAFLDEAGVPRLLDLGGVLYWETGMVLPARGVDAEHILLQALRLALAALPPKVRSGYEAQLGERPREVLIYRGRAWKAIAESARERGLRWDDGLTRYVVD